MYTVNLTEANSKIKSYEQVKDLIEELKELRKSKKYVNYNILHDVTKSGFEHILLHEKKYYPEN